jgi:GNAT superfamily N-acetyltransferase
MATPLPLGGPGRDRVVDAGPLILDGLTVDGMTIEVWTEGACVGAARVYPEDEHDHRVRLQVTAESFSNGVAARLVHAAVTLARSRGARQVCMTGQLGNVDVLTALREELPDNQIHSAGSTWIVTGTLPDAAPDAAASLPLPSPTPR